VRDIRFRERLTKIYFKEEEMTRKLVVFGLILALLALPLVACAKPAPAPTPAPAPKPEKELESFTIKHSTMGQPGCIGNIYVMKPWMDYVEKVTQGRVTVDFYPACALHSVKDALMALETGITDMTWIWNPATPGRFPLMDLFSLPGLMPNQATSNKVLWELFDKYPCFNEQYGDEIVITHGAVHMRGDLHTVKPIRTLKELQGKIIACQDDTGAKALSTLGASTTVMVGSDCYVGAQRGVIDGIFCAWGWVNIFKFHEVAPYHTLLSICPGTTSWGFNRKTWDRFTPFEQMLLKEYKYQGMFNMSRGNVYDSMTVRESIPKENFIELPREDMDRVRELFRPSWEKWADDMEALGYPGHDILEDALHYLDCYFYG